MENKGQRELSNVFKMNLSGIRVVWRNPKIPPSAKVILLDLMFYAGINGESFPSQALLAENLGFKNSRQVGNLLKILQMYGLVSWERGGFGRSNRYTFSEQIYFLTDDTDKKSISPHSGNTAPIQNGNTFPPKVSHESNHLSSVQQLFKKTSNTRVTRSELNRLRKLCEIYTEQWVEDAINELGSRNLPYLKVGLVEDKLKDWREVGKPIPKPIFTPCNQNGCQNGSIYHEGEEQPLEICICKQDFNKRLSDWKGQWAE